ncbi:OmpA family protein [Rhodobacteraceae bacterium KN286]|uniref:OmpA family protein n=2 Tax=Oceanomicrobium pacificus TaxID=2692916 RepID=A0A6B0TNA4_9RHOB|nr:OmpA family protein [Oceanomicrobium pacificus]
MINFDFNSSALGPDARAALDKQAAWLRANGAVRIRIYGHTDAVGSPGYNQALGQRRAQSAVNYLVARGVSRSRMDAVASFGETRPLINTPNRERLNRRTVTEISGFVRGRGADFDGKVANRIYNDYAAGTTAEVNVEGIE